VYKRQKLNDAIAEWTKSQREKQARAFQAADTAHREGDDAGARQALTVANEASAAAKPKGSVVRMYWTAEITNPDAVPRSYCVPDTKKIKAIAKATASDSQPAPIDGVNFVKKVWGGSK